MQHIFINLLYTKYRTNMSWTNKVVNLKIFGKGQAASQIAIIGEFLEMRL